MVGEPNAGTGATERAITCSNASELPPNDAPATDVEDSPATPSRDAAGAPPGVGGSPATSSRGAAGAPADDVDRWRGTTARPGEGTVPPIPESVGDDEPNEGVNDRAPISGRSSDRCTTPEERLMLDGAHPNCDVEANERITLPALPLAV